MQGKHASIIAIEKTKYHWMLIERLIFFTLVQKNKI